MQEDTVTNPTTGSTPPQSGGTFSAFPVKTPQTVGADRAEGKLSGAKVLVIEDEEDDRNAFIELLESENYQVSFAVDGNDALAKASTVKFDLILLDLVMPEKDGLETLRELKSDTTKYGTPIVIVLTSISGDAAIQSAMDLGADEYRLKSATNPDQLLSDIATLLAR